MSIELLLLLLVYIIIGVVHYGMCVYFWRSNWPPFCWDESDITFSMVCGAMWPMAIFVWVCFIPGKKWFGWRLK